VIGQPVGLLNRHCGPKKSHAGHEGQDGKREAASRSLQIRSGPATRPPRLLRIPAFAGLFSMLTARDPERQSSRACLTVHVD
jgi:hypothetical protein